MGAGKRIAEKLGDVEIKVKCNLCNEKVKTLYRILNHPIWPNVCLTCAISFVNHRHKPEEDAIKEEIGKLFRKHFEVMERK